jgi:hypothetical protein
LPKKTQIPISPSIDSLPSAFSPTSRIKTSESSDHKAQKFISRMRLKVVDEKALKYNRTSIIS